MSELQICPQEPLIVGTPGGLLDEALSRHLQSCPSCQQAKELALMMRPLVALDGTRRLAGADSIWIMAQISNPRAHRQWTCETWNGVAALVAAALLAAWSWTALVGYVSYFVPMPAMTMVPLIASCIEAAALAAIAGRTMRRLTGD